LIVVIGVAAAAVPILEHQAAAQVKAEIERDGITKVGRIEVSLLDRRITVLDMKASGNGAKNAIGRWQASGLAWPLGELLQGRTPLAGLRWGDPLRADRIELKDLDITDDADGSRWTFQSLVIDGFDLARFDGSYNGRFPWQVRVARALGALAMRRLEVNNLVVALPRTGDTFGVATTVLEGYDRGRIASLTMKSLEATAKGEPAALYKIDEAKGNGMDWSRLIGSMASADWHPAAPLGRIHVENASLSGFGGEMLARYGISLSSISLETMHDSDKVSRSRTRIAGFVLAPPLRSLQGLQARLALQTMGLKEVKLDLDCAGTEDRAKGELVVGPCTLVGPGLGEIEFTTRIVDADDDFWHALDEGGLLTLGQSRAGLGSARLVLADRSLLERGLKALSTTTGRSLAETRSNLAREIRLYQPADILISQDMTNLLDTIARFVEQGGTLTVEAKPEPPLDLDGIRSLLRPGADLVRLLGVSASLSR
jgi:hypothetical protein